MERWEGKPGGISGAGGGALGIDILMSIITDRYIWSDKLQNASSRIPVATTAYELECNQPKL